MKIETGFDAAGLTDVGCQRENNEDSFAFWEPDTESAAKGKGILAVVADGMGGYEGGQEASRIAVATVVEVFKASSEIDQQSVLLQALRTAHQRIRDEAAARPTLYGMGTTCTAVALEGRALHFAHVGDSRLYLVRDGHIARLTRDHSYVGRLVESGLISHDEAEFHPQRHILTAALGTIGELVTDSPEAPIPIAGGDVLILCSDGLWSQVRDEEMRDILQRKSPAEACQQLIQLARQRGGPDNITVQILRAV